MVELLYEQILKHHEPDHFTFGVALKACKTDMLRWQNNYNSSPSPINIFQKACTRGQVSKGVLWHLRQAVPREMYRALVGDGVDDNAPSRLSPEWSRNVKGDRTRRRRYERSDWMIHKDDKGDVEFS